MADLRIPDIARVRSLAGRLTRDPELRHSASGKAFTTFALAYTRNYRDRDNMTKQESHFFDAKCFDKSAEYGVPSSRSGAPVYVEAALVYRAVDGQGDVRESLESRRALRQGAVVDVGHAGAGREAGKQAGRDGTDAPAADEDILF